MKFCRKVIGVCVIGGLLFSMTACQSPTVKAIDKVVSGLEKLTDKTADDDAAQPESSDKEAQEDADRKEEAQGEGQDGSNNSNSSNSDNDGDSREESSEDSTKKDDAEKDSNNAAAVDMDLTYGNDPNNIYQLSQAPCFGDGRAYYINFNDEVASFALDGSDPKIHGTINNITEMSFGASCLNWRDGFVYYMLTQYREDYTRYVEIRSMNLETGEEQILETCEEGDNPTANGMIIIGDNLLYACYDPGNSMTTATVVNLFSGEKNLLFNKTTRGTGGITTFTTDGANLFLAIEDQYCRIYTIPLAELYTTEPVSEPIAAFNKETVIFEENGIYGAVPVSGTHSYNYEFYPYASAGQDWACETLMEDLIADGEMGSEEGIINNLIWRSERWLLDGATASVSTMNRNLYYSPSTDYTQSASCGMLTFEASGANGTGKYIGEYEDVLYVICQDGDAVSFQTLTADGTFQ